MGDDLYDFFDKDNIY